MRKIVISCIHKNFPKFCPEAWMMTSLNHSLGALLLVENPEGILHGGSNQGQVPFPVVRGDVTRLQDNQKGLERGSYQTRHQQPTPAWFLARDRMVQGKRAELQEPAPSPGPVLLCRVLWA